MDQNSIQNHHTGADLEEPAVSLDSLDIVYAEIKEKLNIQLQQVEASDNKTGTILFIASIAIGIGATAQAAFIIPGTHDWILLLFIVPLLSYFLTVFFGLRSWIGRPYFRDPAPRPLRDHYLSKNVEFTKRRLITQFIHSYEWNARVMKLKTRELRISNLFLLGEIVSLVIVLTIRPWFA